MFTQAGVRVMLGRLQEAVVTLRGHVRQDTAPLLQHGNKKSKQPSPPETVQAALYLRQVSVRTCSPSPYHTVCQQSAPTTKGLVVMPHSRTVSVKGSMALLAYLHPKATCAEAVAVSCGDPFEGWMTVLRAGCEARRVQEPAGTCASCGGGRK